MDLSIYEMLLLISSVAFLVIATAFAFVVIVRDIYRD